MLMVIGSLSAMVADAELAPLLSETCPAMSPPTVPRPTLNVSAVSERHVVGDGDGDRPVAPAAEPAANLTVPEPGE